MTGALWFWRAVACLALWYAVEAAVADFFGIWPTVALISLAFAPVGMLLANLRRRLDLLSAALTAALTHGGDEP
jgi:hypothetical protein